MDSGAGKVVRSFYIIFFGGIILFSLIELCIAGWLTTKYNSLNNYTHTSVRDRVLFSLFCAAWTFCFGAMFVFLFCCGATGILTSVGTHLLVLVLTLVLWSAAAGAITQTVGHGLDCHTEDSTSSQDVFAYCDQLYALGGFSWCIWILVTLTLILVLIRGIRAMHKEKGYAGSVISVD